jgi:ribosomal protein L44E
MTMIGPKSPNQICPECEGEGSFPASTYQEWSEYRHDYVERTTYRPCDTCGGIGRVTRKTKRQLTKRAAGG